MTAMLTAPAIADDTGRRTFLAGGLSPAGLIAACCTTAPAPDATPDAGDSFPVTSDHQFGSATIPQPPQRVVSVGLTDHDMLLALRIKPVAVTGRFGSESSETGPWALPQLAAVRPTVLDSVDSGYPYEQIAVLRPDLIVGAHWGPTEQADYTRLSQIAPTAVSTREFALPPGLAKLVVPGEPMVQVSNEQLSLLNGDLVVWFAYDEDNRKHIENDPLYQSLEVAQEGRVLFLGTGDHEMLDGNR